MVVRSFGREIPILTRRIGTGVGCALATRRAAPLRWYPFKRDAKLSGKLEQAEMQVIEKAKEQVDEHCDYPAKSDNRLSTAD